MKVLFCFVATLAVVMAQADFSARKQLAQVRKAVSESSSFLMEKVMSRRNMKQFEDVAVLFNLLDEPCQQTLLDYQTTIDGSGTASAAQQEAIVECVVPFVTDTFDECLKGFPGVWIPVQCSLESSVAAAIGDDAIDSSSTNSLTNVLTSLDEVDDLNSITLDQCQEIFGVETNLLEAACLAGIEVDDLVQIGVSSVSGFTDVPSASDCQVLIQSGLAPLLQLALTPDGTDDSSDISDPQFNTALKEGLAKVEDGIKKCDERHSTGYEAALSETGIEIQGSSASPTSVSIALFSIFSSLVLIVML